MKTYFADTSYYISVLVPSEPHHAFATEIAGRSDLDIVTTGYVLLELSAFFAKPPHRANFVLFVERLRRASRLTIVPPNESLFDRGWEMYARHIDKGWSLTDCISFLVMRDAKIEAALSSDHHFEQAGFKILLDESVS